MDSVINTDDLCVEINTSQYNNILFDIIEELCGENSKLSDKLKGKVKRIIADCDLIHHSSLHKLFMTDDTTSTVLGFMQQTTSNLLFDEQAELNQAIIQEIDNRLPTMTNELEHLKQVAISGKKSRRAQIKELQESLDDKLNTLEKQQSEKEELMVQWLNHRLEEVMKFSNESSELLSLRARILHLKSKILDMNIYLNIYNETKQSIKAYSEIHKDLKDSLKETEQRIKKFHDIINSDV